MAATTKDELIVKLTLDVASMQAGLQKATTSVNQFADKLSSTVGGVLDLLAIKFAYTFGKNLVQNFADAGAKIGYMSSQLGESVENLGAWGEAIKRNGGTAEGFYDTITKLHNKMQDTQFGGDKDFAGKLGFMGISMYDKNNQVKKSTDLLLELADKFKGKSQGFQQYMGRQLGLDDATIRTISQGRKETEALVAQMKRQGVMSQEQAEKAMAAKKRMDDLNQSLDRLKMNLGEKLLPIFYKISNWVIKFATNDMPKLIAAFDKWRNDLGLSGEDIIKFGVVLGGLAAVAPMINGITTAFNGMGAAIALATSPITAAVAGLLGMYEVYNMIQEKNENPAEFNKKMEAAIPQSTPFKILDWMKEKTGINFTGDKQGTDMWDKVIDWAQGMTETGNKSQIGYKMKKDKNGKYQYVLDAKGNKIPEAFGKYQIMPSTASEVMGRNVTGDELMNDKFNEQVHAKLMDKWTKQFGSKEKALAYYNAGKHGVAQYEKTGTTPYLDKIKSFMGIAPSNLTTKQPQAQNKSGSTINVNNLNVKANNPEQLARQLDPSQTNTALSFSGGQNA